MAQDPQKSPDVSAGKTSGNHQAVNEDLKAKMRVALERKKASGRRSAEHAESREKVHGSEVVGGAPKLHRRKAGGGGS
ncbi:MAG: DUF5302 domain-containing protein [Nocardioides sp.]